MHRTRHALALIVGAALLSLPALAQQPANAPAMPASAADRALMAGMTTMNRDMSAAPMTGDADRDFVAMMMPHHQGAIDMAKAELQYGRDPAMRRLAKNIVAAQEKEIAEMLRWQARHKAQ